MLDDFFVLLCSNLLMYTGYFGVNILYLCSLTINREENPFTVRFPNRDVCRGVPVCAPENAAGTVTRPYILLIIL